MSRTVRRVHPGRVKYFLKDFWIVKNIEFFGYHEECIYRTNELYQSLEDYYQINYWYNRNITARLKKAQLSNNPTAWVAAHWRSNDYRAMKEVTEKVKRAWRQSFKGNHSVIEYEDWDYIPYPKLKTITHRYYY